MDEIIQSFGAGLRFILSQKGMSAEELVKDMNQTGLVKTNKPAISRVMNGKRTPTDTEVNMMADVLESPLLLEAYNLYKQYKDSRDETLLLAFHEVMDRIHGSEATIPANQPGINYDVLYQLIKGLYQQCLANDVSAQLKEGFLIKLYHVSVFSEMIKHLKAMYLCFFHSENLSIADRAWLAAALLYFINPIDLIPDFIVGGGYTDDAAVAGFVFLKLSKILLSYMSKSTENTHTDSDTKVPFLGF